MCVCVAVCVCICVHDVASVLNQRLWVRHRCRRSDAQLDEAALDATLELHAMELDVDAAKAAYLAMPLQDSVSLTGCALLMLSIKAEPRDVYWEQAQVRLCSL